MEIGTDFVVLFCTSDIYCMCVRSGRGIPLLGLCVRFVPSFFPVTKVFQYGKFLSFLYKIKAQFESGN